MAVTERDLGTKKTIFLRLNIIRYVEFYVGNARQQHNVLTFVRV